MNASAAKKNNNRDNTERTEVNIEEFVPYACHYNPHTILTKNGELLQVIKVTGFSYESVHKDEHTRLSLRQAIRMAVLEGIGTDKFAVYFHTIRRKSDLSTGGKYPTLFSKRLNKAWCERHDWERQYTNELYVTVMTEGDFFRAKDLKFFLRSVRFKKELNKRMQFIEDAAGRLENAVIAMMKTLEEYGAHRLEIVKDHEGVCYSELSGFLSKIINLGYEEIPLTTTDLSSVLPSHHVSFGFNALEVRGHTGRHFGAMLTVKEYHEIRSKFIDEFLQIPQEFIVTESFDFVNKRQAMGAFKKQKFYLEVTESEHMAQITGLDEILASDRGEKTDFGQHQIGIMILGDTLSSLDNGVRLALEGLHRIGVLAFREDIFMEDCYWAQLPGNFVFNKRKTYIPLMHIGGYASLYNFPAGKISNNCWGNAVTIFHTAAKTPYFFNFHYGDNGHTFIVGPFGAGKTVLMNFLISETLKFNPRLFVFDYERSSKIFVMANEGDYREITRDKDNIQIRFNPLQLPDTQENRNFLQEWMGYLITEDSTMLQEADKVKIKQAVDLVYTLDERERSLTNVIPKFWPFDDVAASEAAKQSISPVAVPVMEEEPEMSMEEMANKQGGEGMTMEELAERKKAEEAAALALQDDLSAMQEAEANRIIPVEERLAVWYGEGEFSYLFDNDEDGFEYEEVSILGYDMTDMVNDELPVIPLMLYLLHRIEQVLDGNPAVIVLDEAWSLIDNEAFNKRLDQWLDRLQQKNALVVFATESVEEIEESELTVALASRIKTKIFLPNPNASAEGYASVFGLSDKEFQMLLSMDNEQRQFLLIHDIDAVVAELNLAGMDEELAVLASTQNTISLMNGAIRDAGKKPEEWLPVYMERLNK